MSVVKWLTSALTIGFLTFLVISSGSTLQAAENGAAIELAQRGNMQEFQQRAQARFDSMCVYLQLNEKQNKEVKGAYEAMQAEMGKMREQMQSGDREGMREAMQKINADYEKKLDGILTADQKAKLVKWNEAHPRRMGRRQG